MPNTEKTFASPLMQFVVDQLRANKNATYREIADAAQKKGMKLAPIVFGRAKLALGMVKAGQGKTKRAAAAAGKRGPGRPKGSGRGPGRPPGSGRGPGRPRGSNSKAGLDGIEGVIAHVRGLEQEVSDLRDTLAKIAQLAAS